MINLYAFLYYTLNLDMRNWTNLENELETTLCNTKNRDISFFTWTFEVSCNKRLGEIYIQ